MANFKRRSRRKDGRYILPCGCCVGTAPEDRQGPIEEDAPCTGNKRKKRGRWCKGRKGIPHRVTYKKVGTYGYGDGWSMYRYVCEGCGKQWWQRPKENSKAGAAVEMDSSAKASNPERDDHYSYSNIWNRLGDKSCECIKCRN